MGFRRALWAVAAATALTVLAGPARAMADQAGPPKLALADDSVEIGAGGDHVAHVIVKNTGGSTATLKVWAVTGDRKVDGTPSVPKVEAGVKSMTLSFAGLHADERTGTVVITASEGGDPAVAKFNITHRAAPTDLVTLVLVALGLALVFMVVRLFTVPGRPTDAVPGLDSSWKFSDSWASNLVGAGAAAAALIGSSSALADVLGPFSTTGFTLVNLVWLGLIALAPLAYAATRVRATDQGKSVVEGSVGGLHLAAWLTTAGVFGELLTLVVVVHTAASGPTPVAVIGGIVLVVLVALVYVWRSIGFILATNPPTKKSEPETTVAAAAAAALAPARRSAIL